MDPQYKPFVEHLADLRAVLVRLAACLAGGMLVALPIAPYLFRLLRQPFDRADLGLALGVSAVGGGFAVLMRVTVWSGLILSFPFMVMVIGSYLLPALTDRERKLVQKLALASVLLFGVGTWMGFRWTVPVALRFMVRVENWMDTPSLFWETSGYIAFVLRLLLAFGLAFQVPLLLFLLGLAGIVRSDQLRERRRHAIVALLAGAMLLTPPDPFTMVLMGLPLVLLYEGTIWLMRLQELRR